MNKDDMILISVDDHIVEPPDMFKNHLPKKYLDDAPRLVHNPDGSDTWQFRDTVIPNVALNAVAGPAQGGVRPRAAGPRRDPAGLLRRRRAGQGHERRRRAGVDVLPVVPGFAGRLFATEDPEFSLALVQAYNDWHIDEWCGAYPARFIPMALPVIWDAEACAEEVRRVPSKGVHSLTFTENPAALGYPSFHDDYWTRCGRRWCDTDTVLNVHIGSSGRLAITAPGRADGRDDHAAADEHRAGRRRPVVVRADQEVPGPQDRAVRGRHRVDPVLPRSGRPHLRDALDVDASGLRRQAAQRGVPRALPDLLHRRPVGVQLRHDIGIDNICWEADYPHSDSLWPGAPEELRRGARRRNDVPDDEIDKITHENAMRWYHFDPFAHIPREQATVGALRRPPKGHDVSIQSRSQARARRRSTSPISRRMPRS